MRAQPKHTVRKYSNRRQVRADGHAEIGANDIGSGDALKDAKIAVVDDNDRTRQWLTSTLRNQGANVEPFAAPLPVCKYVRTVDVDLVVLDIELLGVDGIDVMKDWRRDRVPFHVIAISRYDYSELARHNGAFEFLQKPFTAKQLVQASTKAYYSRWRGEVISLPLEARKDVSAPGAGSGRSIWARLKAAFPKLAEDSVVVGLVEILRKRLFG